MTAGIQALAGYPRDADSSSRSAQADGGSEAQDEKETERQGEVLGQSLTALVGQSLTALCADKW